jgi:hypothetical protein
MSTPKCSPVCPKGMDKTIDLFVCMTKQRWREESQSPLPRPQLPASGPGCDDDHDADAVTGVAVIVVGQPDNVLVQWGGLPAGGGQNHDTDVATVFA